MISHTAIEYPWTVCFTPSQVLSLLAHGATTDHIARSLNVKKFWVEEALAACRAYFDVSTRSELVMAAIATTVPRSDLAADTLLSDREREVVRLVAQGLADKQIATELGIAIGTVRTFLDRIGRKTGLRRRPDIARAYSKFTKTDAKQRAPKTWEPYLAARYPYKQSSLVWHELLRFHHRSTATDSP